MLVLDGSNVLMNLACITEIMKLSMESKESAFGRILGFDQAISEGMRSRFLEECFA